MINKHGERILVVDDHAEIRWLARKILESAGYFVLEANDGETALDIFQKEKPKLVLLNHHMPGMSGLSVLKKLGEKRETDFAVVMLTVDQSQKLAVQIFRSGADDFIAKPFDEDFLLLVIQRSLRRISMERRLKENKKLAAIGEMASGVTHHFNNIFNVIEISCQLLVRALEKKNADIKSAIREVGVITKYVTRGVDVLNELKVFVRRDGADKQPV